METNTSHLLDEEPRSPVRGYVIVRMPGSEYARPIRTGDGEDTEVPDDIPASQDSTEYTLNQPVDFRPLRNQIKKMRQIRSQLEEIAGLNFASEMVEDCLKISNAEYFQNEITKYRAEAAAAEARAATELRILGFKIQYHPNKAEALTKKYDVLLNTLFEVSNHNSWLDQHLTEISKNPTIRDLRRTIDPVFNSTATHQEATHLARQTESDIMARINENDEHLPSVA